jgi:hypothetical protein
MYGARFDRLPIRHARVATLASFAWVVAACAGEGRGGAAALTSVRRDSAGAVIISLSASPSAVAQAQAGTPLMLALAVDPQVGDWGSLEDVASFSDGTLLALDGLAQTVYVIDSAGQEVRRFGRRGGGPGEFEGAVGVATLGDSRVLVIQARRKSTFSLFSRAGTSIRTESAPVNGDWITMAMRKPTYPYHPPPEDLTRRLITVGPATFAFILQPDELSDSVLSAHVPPAAALLFDTTFALVDTLVRGHGTPLVPMPAIRSDQMPELWEPLFSARLMLAAGDGWYAWSGGADPSVTVRTADNTTLAVRWPASARRITDEDRFRAAEWAGEYTLRQSADARRNAARMSREQREEAYERLAGHLPFADRTPELAALYGAGRCLWLSGFDLADDPLGTALSLIALDVRGDSVLGVVRMPRLDSRIRHVDRRRIYTSYFDEDGVERVEVYHIPFGCGT